MPSTWLSVCFCMLVPVLWDGWEGSDVGDGAVEGGFGAGGFGTEESVHGAR